MTEMVTRVARILMESDTDFESYTTVAVRILEAMREPTEDMVKAGYRDDSEGANDSDTVDQWHRMIDAALTESS